MFLNIEDTELSCYLPHTRILNLALLSLKWLADDGRKIGRKYKLVGEKEKGQRRLQVWDRLVSDTYLLCPSSAALGFLRKIKKLLSSHMAFGFNILGNFVYCASTGQLPYFYNFKIYKAYTFAFYSTNKVHENKSDWRPRFGRFCESTITCRHHPISYNRFQYALCLSLQPPLPN